MGKLLENFFYKMHVSTIYFYKYDFVIALNGGLRNC